MSKAIRAVHIIYSGLGGHASVFSSFVVGDLDERVVNHVLYYGVEPLNMDYQLFCEEKKIPYRYISKKKGLDRESWRQIRQQLQQWNPDIVLMHSCYTILPVSRYVRKAGIPLITVEHTANQHKGIPDWIWTWVAMRRSDKVVFLTESYREEVKRKLGFGFQQAKASIIPNGLNLDLFIPLSQKSTGECRIGMHARLAPPKDFATLIRAFAQLCKQAPEHNFRLMIAGDGVFRDELEALTRELQVDEEVEFLGMLNETEVIQFLQGLDLYVHSTFGETMSTAIMQAMAVRLPIVVSDIEGTRNMLQEENTGLFFQNEKPEQLAACLLRLAETPELGSRLAENAYLFAQENYGHIRMFSRYLELMNQLL